MHVVKTCLAVCVAVCVTTVGWGDTWTDLDTGLVWTYTVSGGGATIGGGRTTMPAVPTDTRGSVVVPSTLGDCPVVGIASYAFYGCSSIEALTAPEGLKSIGFRAFTDCSLSRIELPSTISSVDSTSFERCSNVTNATLPGWSCRLSLSKLEDLTITPGTTRISGGAFANCVQLKRVNIPSGVTIIDYEALKYCSNLLEVTLPDGLTTIGENAFRGCNNLEVLTIPSSVTNIGVRAFGDCAKLAEMSVPSGVTELKPATFSYCKGLNDVSLPDGLTSIGDYAFDSCSSLTNLVIPKSVTRLGRNSCRSCSALTTVNVPSSITEIGADAFASCLNLQKVELSTQIQNIPSRLFYGCSKLKEVAIPAGVTNIDEYAFADCLALKDVVLPRGLGSIGSYAFANCDALTTTTVPDSVVVLGAGALSSFTSVDFEGRPPEGVLSALDVPKVSIRYNAAYADEWAVVIAALARSGSSSELVAESYVPAGWVAPEEPYEGSFAVTCTGSVRGSSVTISWQSRGVLPSAIESFALLGWHEPGTADEATVLMEDVPTPRCTYQLKGMDMVNGTICRLFAVRYRFTDGSEYVSEPFDLRSSIPARLCVEATDEISFGTLGLNWCIRGLYEDPAGGEAMVHGAAPQGWPWSDFCYGQTDLLVARSSDSPGLPSAGYWYRMENGWCGDGRYEYTLNPYDVAIGESYDLFVVRCEIGRDEYNNPLYLYSNIIDISAQLPESISIEATGSCSNGVITLSWKAKAQYATGEGPTPAGWPWDQAYPQVGGALNADGYIDYNSWYAGMCPEVSWSTNGTGTAKITLNPAGVAMGYAYACYQVRFEFFSDDSYGYWRSDTLESQLVDVSESLPSRIVPEVTGAEWEGSILKVSWKMKAYKDSGSSTVECAIPEGWPWNNDYLVEVYGQNPGGMYYDRSLGDDWQRTGVVNVYQSAYAVAAGTAPTLYEIRLTFNSMYEVRGPQYDCSALFPGCIRLEAKGALDSNGLLSLSWEPHAYVTDAADAQECPLPKGWPWEQGKISVCGTRADRKTEDPYCDMPIYVYGSEYIPMVISEAPFYLSAYDVAMGYANNVYRIRYDFYDFSSPFAPYNDYNYLYCGTLTSSLVDLRDKLPGCIRLEAHGTLDNNGMVNITCEPHAYESTLSGAAECTVPEGWPWMQNWITLCGSRASKQEIDPYCSSMSIPGYEYIQGDTVQVALSAYDVAMGYANNVYRIRYDLVYPMSYSGCYMGSGSIESTLVDFRDLIPGCIRIEATGGVDNGGNVVLTWTPVGYESTAEGAASCGVPSGWPWGQGCTTVCGARVQSAPDENSFWGLPLPPEGWNMMDGNSCSIPLSAYDVAMGYAYNAYQVRYEIWPSYSLNGYGGMSGTVSSNPVDLRSQFPGCIRMKVTGELVNGEVQLKWAPKAYAADANNSAECALPSGWPWSSGGVEVCGYHGQGGSTPPMEVWYPIGWGNDLSGSKTVPLSAGEVAMGGAYNMYTVRLYTSSSSPWSGSGYLMGDVVDLTGQIPCYVELITTASVDAGKVKADWSLVAHYDDASPSRIGLMPEGWPWGASVEVSLFCGSELARASVANGADTLSGVLVDPQTNWLTLTLRDDYSFYLNRSLELPTANLTVASSYGNTSPYSGTTCLVKGALLESDIDIDVYEGDGKRHLLTGWKLEGATNEKGMGKTCNFVLTGDTTLTWLWLTEGEPSLTDDPGATVTGDAESGFTVTPSAEKKDVEVTIPEGVEPEKVTVEIGTEVETIKANGANVKIVKGANDITDYLNIPAADASGTINLTQAAVKEEIVKETLDPDKGAVIELDAAAPTLRTAETKPGLTYTLKEGSSLEDMATGDSKVGDGQPWTPNITVKGGSSGFYSIGVTK